MSLALTPVRKALVAIAVIALVVVLGTKVLGDKPYSLTLLMPAADQTFVGGKVLINGRQVGTITDIGVRERQAQVSIEIDDEFAPLPAGTKARVKWESVLGARIIELDPGKKSNPALRSGHLLTNNVEGVELDDLLAMLDAPTRKKVQALLAQTDRTLAGREADLNATLKTAGPTIQALGAVLRAVGEDGPAIKQLVTQLHGVASTVAGRNTRLASSISNLNALTAAVSTRQSELSALLEKLPGTIGQATTTLDSAEDPVQAARALLRDLQPSTAQLPAISRDLKPVLAGARPALEDLTPTLADADALLKRTPALLTGVRDLLPDLDDTLVQANPMVSFLRPYTPELAGWLSNWVGIFGSQNATGNYARALITASASSLDDVLPGVPPGMGQSPRPEPGSLADQAWTDANGDPIQ